jgi:hydrogenase nickel incorporation protein HypA/HybF
MCYILRGTMVLPKEPKGLRVHELQIATRITDTIEEQMQRRKLSRIRHVTVRIGVLSGVDPSALSFTWAAATANTALEGATLEIQSVPLIGRCRQCAKEFEIVDLLFRCPDCQSVEIDLTSGQEIEIASFTINDPDTE